MQTTGATVQCRRHCCVQCGDVLAFAFAFAFGFASTDRLRHSPGDADELIAATSERAQVGADERRRGADQLVTDTLVAMRSAALRCDALRCDAAQSVALRD